MKITSEAARRQRPGTLLHIQWSDLDFAAGEIAWRARWDKTGRERVQPMTEGARRAGVQHLRYRAMHGFRRAVAGDVLELTQDLQLALDWIGDVDRGMARRYLRPRDPRLEEAATAVDPLLGEIGDRNRRATVTESGGPWDPDTQPSGELECPS